LFTKSEISQSLTFYYINIAKDFPRPEDFTDVSIPLFCYFLSNPTPPALPPFFKNLVLKMLSGYFPEVQISRWFSRDERLQNTEFQALSSLTLMALCDSFITINHTQIFPTVHPCHFQPLSQNAHHQLNKYILHCIWGVFSSLECHFAACLNAMYLSGSISNSVSFFLLI
jgi:hypothetical protein